MTTKQLKDQGARLVVVIGLWVSLALGAHAEGVVQGQVTGQDPKGEHLGPIAGAVVEILDPAGTVAVKATTDEFGSYEVEALAAGNYTYRITAEGFMPENVGRGFAMPATPDGFVLDLILTKGDAVEETSGQLSGHVWRGSGEEKVPVSGARVALRPVSGGNLSWVKTDAEGRYQIILPTGEWKASAIEEALGNAVHPETISVASGAKVEVDFRFAEPEMEKTQVFILVAVERLPDEKGELPELRLKGGAVEIDGLELVALGPNPRGSDFFRDNGLELDRDREGDWQWFLASSTEKSPVPPGLYNAMGSLEGYRNAVSATKTVTPDHPAIFDLTFGRMQPTVDVIVENKDGTPLPNVNVRFVNRTIERSLLEVPDLKTDESGKVNAKLEDGFGEYNVVFDCDGYPQQTRPLEVNQESHEFRVRLLREGETPTVDFVGTVGEFKEWGDAENHGISFIGFKARIELSPAEGQKLPAGFAGSVETGDDGKFSIRNLEEGDYTYVLEDLAVPPNYKRMAGTWTMELDMTQDWKVEMDPFNQKLEDHIHSMLTKGWGSESQAEAARFYDLALKEAPDDCRVEYARALIQLSLDGDNEEIYRKASGYLSRAIKKPDQGMFWDRACESGVTVLMLRGKEPAAAGMLDSLCKREYAMREPSEASQNTAYFFGFTMGFLMGPGSTPEVARGYGPADRECRAALQGVHLEKYIEGFDRIPGAVEDQKKHNEEALEWEKGKAADEQADQAAQAQMNQNRIMAIDGEIAGLQGRIRDLDNQFQRNWPGGNPNGRMVQLQQSINALQLRRNQPQGKCLECGYFNANCAACQNAHNQGCMQIDRQLGILQAEMRELQGMGNLFRNAERDLEFQKRPFLQQIDALEGERANLQGNRGQGPDIQGKLNDIKKDIDARIGDFQFYAHLPIEMMRDELLDSLKP